MPLLKNFLIGLRNDTRLLRRLPPYLSLLCIALGLAWLLILPLDLYSRHTYISENALLPGQVHTYFGGSEHDIFRAYRHEVAALLNEPGDIVASKLGEIFKSQGLKVAQQKYAYNAGGTRIAGNNVYAILQAPRADATEALVLMAAWKNIDDVINQSGVALVLTLARYFNKWSLWSKDIIFVVTEDSTIGPQAWVDAYHSTNDPAVVDDLPIKSGALQAAMALDYTAGIGGHRFDKIHVVYDGINGQLPNLDLFNTAVYIASPHMHVGCTIQRMWNHDNGYTDRLQTLFRGVLTQALGQATGPHSSFIPYHVDAITLQAVGDGWQDEVSLGRVVESTFRSLNNLLEHLHQSFFLYLLMQAERFVSIGTYLPSAMLIAVSFSIMSILYWFQSGLVTPATPAGSSTAPASQLKTATGESLVQDGLVAVIPKAVADISRRNMFYAMAFVTVAHVLGLLPLYLFNKTPVSRLINAYFYVSILSTSLPPLVAFFIYFQYKPSAHTLKLIPCISLLILGVSLSTLSTLNFPLGLIVGLLASPLAFVSTVSTPDQAANFSNPSSEISTPSKLQVKKTITIFYVLGLYLFSPTTLIMAWAAIRGPSGESLSNTITAILYSAAEAWHVSGVWTGVVVWLLWWPAWLVGTTVGYCGIVRFSADEQKQSTDEAQNVTVGSSGQPSTLPKAALLR